MPKTPSCPDVFLCHSHADKAFVRTLARDLHDLSVYAWFDEWELAPGDSLHDSIGKALEKATYVIVVLSPDSVSSNWCQKELKQALAREVRSRRKVVIPVRYRAAKMPPFLEDKFFVDFGDSYYSSLTALAAHIHKIEPRRVAESISAAPPTDVGQSLTILRQSGLLNQTFFGSLDWRNLLEIFARHSLPIVGQSLTIMHPKTGRRHDCC